MTFKDLRFTIGVVDYLGHEKHLTDDIGQLKLYSLEWHFNKGNTTYNKIPLDLHKCTDEELAINQTQADSGNSRTRDMNPENGRTNEDLVSND